MNLKIRVIKRFLWEMNTLESHYNTGYWIHSGIRAIREYSNEGSTHKKYTQIINDRVIMSLLCILSLASTDDCFF